MIASGQPVIAFGGITGREQTITPEQLAQRAATGAVRFVLIGALASPGSGSSVSQWVRRTCAVVPAAQWAGEAAVTGGQTLYGCGALAQRR